MIFFKSVLSTSIAVAVFAVQAASEAVRIDGGDKMGWSKQKWYVQVDGVMGGKSSGQMEFLSNDSVMKFTGDIILDGGGFSSVRRRIDLDLTEYAGVVVTLEADGRGAGRDASPPTGLHLQFDDRTSFYDFSAAFAVPLSNNADGTVVTSVYLPIKSFDRGTSFGFECQRSCNFDPSEISGMSVYVLFQEGSFDVRLRSIEAVTEPRSFFPPAYDNLESETDIVNLIRSTISSGGGLYDKSYVELCIAMYWSVLNTILSSPSSVVTDPIRAVICAGLQQVNAQMEDGDSKQNIAWTIRYAMDALIADLEGFSRTSDQYWLPTRAEAASMETTCIGRTSAAPGFLYDPTNTNEIILVSEEPTSRPKLNPTSNPTMNPTASPTTNPTVSPTGGPTARKEFPTENNVDEEDSLMDNTGEHDELLTAIEDDEGEAVTDNEMESLIDNEMVEEEAAEDSWDEEFGNSTLAFDEDDVEDPILIEFLELRSGSSTLSGRGFEYVAVGILVIRVVQVVL